MSELDDRRQRATEAYWDAKGTDHKVWHVFTDGSPTSIALDAALETATRVRITPEIERAAYVELGKAEPGRHHAALRLALRAAFEAAGLEVEE